MQMRKVFYQNNRLGLIVDGSAISRFVGAGGVLLACNDSHEVSIFAIDSAGSVLSKQKPSESRSQFVYGAYGFCHALIYNKPDIGFKGEALDIISSGYLLGRGERLYLPSIMRFSSCDKLSLFASDEYNGYAFCSGDPINFSDPSGRARVFQAISPLKVLRTINRVFKKPLARKVSVIQFDEPNWQGQVTNLADVTRSFKPEKFDNFFKRNYPGQGALRDAVSATNAMPILATPPEGTGLLATVNRHVGHGGFGGAVKNIDFRGVTAAHAKDIRYSMQGWEGSGDWYYGYMRSADFSKILDRYQGYRSKQPNGYGGLKY